MLVNPNPIHETLAITIIGIGDWTENVLIVVEKENIKEKAALLNFYWAQILR